MVGDALLLVEGPLVDADPIGAAVSKPVFMLVEARKEKEVGDMGRRGCRSGRRWRGALKGLGVTKLGLTHPCTTSHTNNASTASR